uniref:SH3 domain-containing protein n=1 Tax=Periophthalmus magnuspinnatus TaxID=409849 RepID=A0A3B4A254_9GOBI
MAASMLYRIIGLFLLNVIHFTSGLLSDYKICGDPECESRMSRVQALEDHYSKDCRFLSFRQGDIIFVYHKLTGKREDLWAGSIDRRFGYFPKAAVKEEEIYAKAEKVLETHVSIFCVFTQIMSPTLESPSQKLHETFVDTKTKSGQEEDGDNVESPNDQSGSSSWLRSSVTGLWGLVKKGDSSTNSEEDATKEMPELSVTSSVTGWLGFGAKHNGESGEELGTQDTQASSNLDSTMTGWLNFGSEVKEQDNTKSAQVDKPGEVFRSRKLALDFEDNQVHQEENKETGTLGWIGNGISSTLGFGSNNKDSGKGKSEETDKNLEPTSHSWFDVGITDMLGFRKDLAKENINRIEDLPVSEQNTDTLPNIPRLEQSKQLEIMEEKVVEIDSTNLNKDIKQSNDDYNLNTETNVIQRGSSNHNGPEIKPEHTEVELHTSDATSMEDRSKSVEFKDPKQLDEDTTISSNSKSTFDSQVIYDQDVHPLQLEHNVTEGKMDLLLENNADTQIDELAQNGSKFEISDTGLQMNEEESMQVEELHSSKVNEADSSEVNTNREVQDTLEDQKSHQEMPSTIKLINDIQDVFNDKKAMSEEVIETKQDVVSALPDDIRPGPDLYGVPWEPVIISGLVGLITILIFTCRCYSSVSICKERRMAEQVAQLLDEKCKVLETLSKVQQESLTDRLLQMKAWDSDLEEEQGAEETLNGIAGHKKTSGKRDITDPQGHLQKVQKLIHAAKLNADLKSVDEDKDRIFAKLNDEVKAKEDLQESIKGLEIEKLSLQSDAKHYSDQVQILQQKLQIMTEMYQENELKLHRLLTVEEKERLQKEEKLSKADKNIAMAMEELNNYRQRAEEMEEELEKTKQSYQTQISSHEKKAHNNWLAARSAERELAEIRRENALFRQKLTDTQFKLEAIEKDPYALDTERSSYGPSPLGRPASETRAFLSPPTLMDGPPNRLSPRVMRGPLEPLLGPGETERPGGPHSDSGSISPTWERDRRGPPPGSMSGPLPGPPGPMAPPRKCWKQHTYVIP